MMSLPTPLVEGLIAALALTFRPEASPRRTSPPKRPDRGETRCQSVLRYSPRPTSSSAGRKLSFVFIKCSKHCPTLHCSAEGFQLSCAAERLPKSFRASVVIAPSSSISRPSSLLLTLVSTATPALIQTL